MKKPPFQSVTIPHRPSYLPEYMQIIVLETCTFCRRMIENPNEWAEVCQVGTLAHDTKMMHQKRIIVIDMRR